MSDETLQVDVSEQAGSILLTPHGELGYSEAPTLRQFLKQAHDKKPTRIIVDLSDVSYMNTPGVATLVESLQISKRNRNRLILCGMNDKVRAIFEIARLNTVFEIMPDRDAALT
jgi:anti-sigma B factor antagonist